MKLLLYLSDAMIPLVVFYIVGYGLIQKQSVYEDFVEGAKDGFKIVIQIMPTLIGLLVGVGILRASGFLDLLADILSGFTKYIGFPSKLVPLAIVRLFSSSAATGLVLDIFKEYGTDSQLGTISSIMMGCTETIFYTIAVYSIAAKVKKTRWTLVGSLICTTVGVSASVVLARML
ncbi:spore maturation protein [Anaerosacchariphilus polymeriproducens]|uniref:Spore maturation protein n=1 Tax=Anaerosacchariphilus polymeriproducens TaxID=1812858 RepID=A0A371ATF1_9FIRM|nr:nucleoside recognition domain-containing protein [Anaerosacchariphilus polymeriproducens]RDU22828.1 spore maturation protein [Anaerosacchariphilus polymeriproducens]